MGIVGKCVEVWGEEGGMWEEVSKGGVGKCDGLWGR